MTTDPSDSQLIKDEVFTVYILRTSSDTLYVGQTNNLDKRLRQHQSKGKSASKYLRSFASFRLVYSERFTNRHDAMVREIELKRLSKVKKEALIQAWFLSNASSRYN